VVNVVELLGPRRFDSSLWWIDLRFLPPLLRAAVLSGSALALLGWLAFPRASRTPVLALLIVLTAIACRDGIRYYMLLARGSIATTLPIPVSAFVALALGWMTWHIARAGISLTTHPVVLIATVTTCLFLFPLLQMICFGATDYRRRADVIIVPGARTHADGRPSQALADRVRTACRLYHAGYAPLLVFSGGPGDGPVQEVEAMRTLALQSGVPEGAIVLDPHGINTAATAHNAVALLHARGAHRALLVTHFYHTARAKIAFGRDGADVFTVPAQSDRTLAKLPWFMAREAAAIWSYYLAPAVRWSE
jgi:uncharacterized SAM-binding protein YcdF (DUF218 family)